MRASSLTQREALQHAQHAQLARLRVDMQLARLRELHALSRAPVQKDGLPSHVRSLLKKATTHRTQCETFLPSQPSAADNVATGGASKRAPTTDRQPGEQQLVKKQRSAHVPPSSGSGSSPFKLSGDDLAALFDDVDALDPETLALGGRGGTTFMGGDLQPANNKQSQVAVTEPMAAFNKPMASTQLMAAVAAMAAIAPKEGAAAAAGAALNLDVSDDQFVKVLQTPGPDASGGGLEEASAEADQQPPTPCWQRRARRASLEQLAREFYDVLEQDDEEGELQRIQQPAVDLLSDRKHRLGTASATTTDSASPTVMLSDHAGSATSVASGKGPALTAEWECQQGLVWLELPGWAAPRTADAATACK